MLGNQGSAHQESRGDPASAPRFDVPSSSAFNVLRLAIGSALAAFGLWIALTGNVLSVGRVLLGLASAAFAYLVISKASGILRHKAPTFTPEGLAFDIFGVRKFVAWSNIAETSIWQQGLSRSSVLALRNADVLVSQFEGRDLNAAIHDVRFGNFLLSIFGGLPAPTDSNAPENAHAELARFLASNRQRYGGEILLGAADRDRSPESFNALVEAWKEKYATH